jgi:2-dehydropantoate 2-reductase
LGNTLDQLQQIGFACRFIEDEPTLMWSKLVFLAPVALTTTATDESIGKILSDSTWRSQLESSVRETCVVAIAEGAQFNPEIVLNAMEGMPPSLRSFMQKDGQDRRTPELDAIAGPILRGARRHHIEVPVTRKLVTAVEQKAGSGESPRT